MKLFFQMVFITWMISAWIILAQDIDIVPYLKQIEAGEINSVKDKLPDLKVKYPGSPAIMFLDGVLTEDGQQAVAIYQTIIEKYPKSRYADAATYRVFSYFYALGLYEAAGKMRDKLKNDYPDSPYNKLAEANRIPSFDSSPVSSQEKSTDKKDPDQIKARTDYKFTIQAGAFSNSDNAVNLRDDFQQAGYVCEIKEKNVGGTIFQVVYVGKFVVRKDAEDFLHIINSKYDLTGRIVEIAP